MIISDPAIAEAPRAGPGEVSPARGGRRPFIDIARGIAVVGMVVYHTAWDLSQLDLIATDIQASTPWGLFARAVAASFLVLSGVGLVLAHGAGFRRNAFARRFAILAGAALLVTAATRVVFPDAYIFFGILHNLAVSSLLALPFVRAAPAVTSGIAALLLAAPLVARSPVLDAPLLSFLGLGSTVPVTNDYVPIFPWTGFVLAGIAGARVVLPRLAAPPAKAGPTRLGSALATLGRHSLAIYLLHQPVIFGALSGVRAITGPNEAAEAAPYMTRCTASCQAAGQAEALCRTACSCTVTAWKRDGLWTPILLGRAGPDEVARASDLARACLPGAG